ncbi:MAG TPA: TlpA disulfide reductase family protein, partial [Chitinophagaceae bacterium]|nr:TlpA disulfide reductase family protein [Chitinophagaceae bacterium]
MKNYLVILIVCAMATPGWPCAQGNTAGNDSLSKADSRAARAIRRAEMDKVYEAKDGEGREDAYLAFVGKYPPSANDKSYDYLREAVALGFARVNNVPGALRYLSLIEARTRKAGAGVKVAQALMVRGQLTEAERLFKESIASAQEMMAGRGMEDGLSMAKSYAIYCGSYADLLYRQKNYPLALKYEQLACDSAGELKYDFYTRYAQILLALGRDEEAFNKMDEAIKAGRANEAIRQSLDTLYRKIKGSNAGFDTYIAEVDRQLMQRYMERLPSKMIDEPAPAFTLEDLKGNTVSLDDYKGKTVVVDFWATWCGPCKASFPAMQLAVNRYKDSPDVKFLFIHTWERERGATRLARRYIKEMKYTFQVLMDLKDEATGT